LAEAEIALFTGQRFEPESLELTAWYLHSVASALPALELYGIDRQRQCYQVAAHIFDLLVSLPGGSRQDRLRKIFASQLGYIRGELTPNASAVRRRDHDRAATLSFRNNLDVIALEVGAACLAMDTRWLYPRLRELREQESQFFGTADARFGGSPYSGAIGVTRGIDMLLRFLVRGEREALARAKSLFAQTVALEEAQGDLDSRWVAVHLGRLCDDLPNSSIWTALPPDIPDSVRRTFAMGSPPVLTLWPPQLQAARLQPSPLSREVHRSVLSLPTSAGKTLFAQLIMAVHMAVVGDGVCIVAPTRSLCREIEQSLRSRLMFFRHRVAVEWFDGNVVEADTSIPDVMVVTPERLHAFLRDDPMGLLGRVGLFVFDEAHSIADGRRGWLTENALTVLLSLTEATTHRIVCLSAAIGNRLQFAQWLDPSGTGTQWTSDWRGPRRLYGLYSADMDPSTRRRSSGRRAGRFDYDLKGTIRLRVSADGTHRTLALTRPVGTLVLDESVSPRRRVENTPLYKAIVPLARILSMSGPVLLIAPTRNEARLLALAIAEPPTSTTRELAQLAAMAERKMGVEHSLPRALRNGVGYHHAGVPVEVLVAMEAAFLSGDLRMLVATTTLTEGVNLPARTVIITAQGARDSTGTLNEYITGARLLNAIGRAGRAAIETEGWVILARQGPVRQADWRRLTPDDAELEVRSRLMQADALDIVAEYEARVRESDDALLGSTDEVLTDFVAFVWMVAGTISKSGEEVTEERVQAVLERSLAWHQANDIQKGRWIAMSGSATRGFIRTDGATRLRWVQSGLSLASARAVDRVVSDLHREIGDAEIIAPLDALEKLLTGGRLESLLGLVEHHPVNVRTQRGGRGTQAIRLDYAGLTRAWLAGESVESMADTFLGAVADRTFRSEQLSDVIATTCEHFMPWAVGVVVRWLNDLRAAAVGEEAKPFCPELPMCIRHGVSSIDAVKLARQGVARDVAIRMANRFQEDEEGDLRVWLRSLGIEGWVRVASPSRSDLRALIQYARSWEAGVAGRVLEMETAVVPILPIARALTTGDCALAISGLTGHGSTVVVVRDGEDIAYVTVDYAAEVEALLTTGIPLAARVIAEGGIKAVEITLAEADARGD
jgi:hypothetical protein